VSFLDNILQGGATAADLATTDVPVNVSNSTPPNPGDVLKAVDATHATWQPGGGAGSDAGGLETTGDPVDVSNAAPPVAGQVLTAVDAEHAEWRVPGLHYDPGIKFWTNSVGSATIGPGTWGFISQPADGVTPVVVYIVSSLEAPPVDSRFGLYVGRDVTVPVTVSVLGASQIQGTDGVLASSTSLLPGADYEWVFYHEDGAALWGLVSDTAGIAKRIAVAGGTVEVASSAAPVAGHVLIALDGEHAAWSDVGPAVWPTLGDAFTNAIHVDAIVSAASDLYGNSGGTETDGIGYGVELTVLAVAQSDPSENGFWVTHDGTWPRGLPLPEDTLVGQLVVVDDGTEFAGSMWTYRGDGQWDQISPGSPIAGGDFMVRVGKEIHLVGPITAGVHGNLSGGALHADATTTVSGFFSGAEKLKLQGIQASAAAVSSTAPTQITVTTAAAGAATDAARRDHVHSVSVGTPTSLTVGGSNNGGTSNQLARADHVHALPAYGSTSGTFAQGNDTRFLKASTLSGSNDVSISGAPAAVNGQVLQAYAATTAAWLFQNIGGINQLRLSVSSSEPIPTSDVPAATTLYLLPYTGSLISLISTSLNQAVPMQLTTSSLALSGLTTDTVYDVFAYLTNQGNPFAGAIGLELLAWSSATARATGLVRGTYGNMWVKSGDISRRYLGTIRARSATTISWRTQGNDTNPPRCDLWNVDNQEQLAFSFGYANATYAVSVGSAWQVLGNAKLEFVQGIQNTYTNSRAIVSNGHASAGNEGNVSMMLDAATTVPVGLRGRFKVGAANEVGVAVAEHRWLAPIGSRTLSLALLSNVTTQVFYGYDGGSLQSGFYVDVTC